MTSLLDTRIKDLPARIRTGWRAFVEAVADARAGRPSRKYRHLTPVERRRKAHQFAEHLVGHPLSRKAARRTMRRINKARGLPSVGQSRKAPLPPVPAPPSFYRSPTSSP